MTKQCCFCGSTEHNTPACGWGSRVSDNHLGWEVQVASPRGWINALEDVAPFACMAGATEVMERLQRLPGASVREYRVYEALS